MEIHESGRDGSMLKEKLAEKIEDEVLGLVLRWTTVTEELTEWAGASLLEWEACAKKQEVYNISGEKIVGKKFSHCSRTKTTCSV